MPSPIRFGPTYERKPPQLLQLRVLRFRSDEDGDVRVGVFPEREEILIGRLGLGGVALHGVGSADLEMGECAKELSLPKILSGANAFEISDIQEDETEASLVWGAECNNVALR